ncbi:ATP-binding protein [Spirillospora sp. NPDC048819]|uniref:ATP-binding protein n=1 Tax=Spirillospora sp. NPDC048819 TaxID=3155268 RepID=UPI0033F81F1C
MDEHRNTTLRRGGITRARQGARTYVWRLDERAPGDARRAVREALAGWGVKEADIDVAMLLTSEVVTNAVRHVRAELRAGGVVWVRVRVMDGRLRVDVTDPEPGFPRLVAASDTDEGHRGMAVVAGCADRWGWHPGAGGGKTVWWTQVLEVQEPASEGAGFKRVLSRSTSR